MSYSLSTSQGSLSLGQNHSGSVAVASFDQSAGLAHKNSFGAFKSLLGSRSASGTCHRCVSGRHNHHRSARPLTIGNQFAFRLPDRVVGCLARHRGLEQEFGAEVLHGDHLMSRDDFADPLPGRVLALPGNFLVEFRGLFLRGFVTVRSCFARLRCTSSHATLIFREPDCGGFRALGRHEVVFGLGRGRDSGHTPVDPDRPVNLGQRRLIDSDNETRVPVAETVLEHPDAAWFAGKFPMPHHRDPHTLNVEVPIFDAESVAGVLQGWKVALLFERAPALTGEGLHCLFLGVLRTVPQPAQFLAGNSQIGTLKKWSLFVTGRNHLVPQPPTPIPLSRQHAGRLRAGTQSVVVAKHRRCCRHKTTIFDRSDIPRTRRTRGATVTRRPYLPIAKARGIAGGFRGVLGKSRIPHLGRK